MSKFNPFNSTIFNKIVMAATGAILVLFLIGHCVGNLQIFLGQDVFNTYAHFLQSTGELLWIVRLVLLASILLHVVTSLKLKSLNNSAKPEGYRVKSYVKSTLYSRSMIYSGIVIFLLAVYHLLHFTAQVTNPEYAEFEQSYGPKLKTEALIEMNGEIVPVSAGDGIFQRHDAYKMVIAGFNKWYISVVYILFVFFVGLHLAHAVQSMFQTLGWNGPRLSPILTTLSKVIGWGLFLGFSSVPVAVWIFGLGKGVLGV
ncbi:MAG: succinate dehydrogenase cytochrome b subunit [Candidatus Kapabacteria bacterium]|nr:succinate dehydrogenase cytochrome b subunit [Ignavibacteriota bacterium]MCW5884228.1 succinate dehydrogenase cytochrome b subunit [Candidatus Kapabacteria bacterium]